MTDADIRSALGLLRMYPSGVTHRHAVKLLGGDRHTRDVMAALNERAIAAVLVLDDGHVYRLARDVTEVNRATEALYERERGLRRQREGMMRAFEAGNQPHQPDLFA